jgi:hypothetical protein
MRGCLSVWLVRKVSHSTDARRAPIFHNTDSASQVQNKPCDGVTPCKEEVFSENVTSVTSCHNGHSDASRHVTSPYKGCDGVTRDMTTDVTAGNAEGQRAVEEVEQHSNGPPAGSSEPAPSVPPDIEVVFKDVEP